MPTQTLEKPKVKTSPQGVRWRLKGCPKCGGDLFLHHEKTLMGLFFVEFKEFECLQCSYTEEIK